ncbi:MAG: ribulose-phosphate 3-epimerase [Oscillospiraceae bacterium]
MSMSIWNEKCIISPSLISVCDLCNLEGSVRELERAGIKMLHIDILDGHFSPSMPLGLDTVRRLRALTDMEFDVHVMATEHDYFVAELLDIGIQQLVFHGECEPHIDNRLNMIKKRGVRAGVALKPATSLCSLEYIIEKCDAVLLMLINPGYAGSSTEGQVPYAERKIKALRQLINERNLKTKIEIDGRISKDDMVKYGNRDVDIFVAGSTCLDKNNLTASAERLLECRKTILQVEGV